MGWDYDPKLVIGWSVDRELVLQWLCDEKVGSCEEAKSSGDGVNCTCGKQYCWTAWPEKYKQFTFEFYSPFPECEPVEQEVYLSVEGLCDYGGITIATFNAMLESIDMEEGKELAVKVGANTNEPSVIMALHVY